MNISFSIKNIISICIVFFVTFSAYSDTKCRVSLPFGNWTEGCPHIHVPSHESDSSSCLAVMTYPEEYKWHVKNRKSYNQKFWIDKKEYKLGTGETHYFTSKVGFYSTSSCGGGTRYIEPTIKFDRYAADGTVTYKKISVDVTNHSSFFFWKDGNTIKFSKKSK